MNSSTHIGLIILGLIVLIVIIAVFKSFLMVKQGYTVIVERLGKYQRTLQPGLHLLVPFFDSVRQRIDMREQVMPFPPQPVITSDNINVSIDTVIYYQVTDPVRATYGISNPLEAIEQLAATTLRNIIGTMDMEQALTGRDQINGQLRGVLDEATGQWGIRVARVELKAIEPPRSVQGAMEQQMKAERDRRAAILTAEGVKQSAVLTAEGGEAVGHPAGGRPGAVRNSAGSGRGPGHPPGLRRHPSRQCRSEAAVLRVHQDPPSDRQLQFVEALDRPDRAHGRPQRDFAGLRRRDRSGGRQSEG